MKPLVLVVDDDKRIIAGIGRALRHEPYELIGVDSPFKALDLLRNIKVNVVISDYKMPGMNGIELFSEIKKHAPEIVRILITGVADLNTAIESINRGEVYRFFNKPYNEIELALAIRQGLEQVTLMDSNRRMLEVLQMQSSYINNLESMFPGISKVDRDDDGAVLAADISEDLGTLIEQASAYLNKESTRK